MDKKRKAWKDLSERQRRNVAVTVVVAGILQAVMLWDVWRRPAERVRGSKRAWVLASFIRPFGQISYLLWGRTRG